jgi:hypothetical protein
MKINTGFGCIDVDDRLDFDKDIGIRMYVPGYYDTYCQGVKFIDIDQARELANHLLRVIGDK